MRLFAANSSFPLCGTALTDSWGLHVVTVLNQRGSERIVLPRVNGDAFWETVREHYAHDDPRCWKFLAMFALHTTAGMSLEKIGHAFGHPPGHVSRCLQTVRRELRERFRPPDGGTDEIDHSSPMATDH